jgi:hypothetical protein
MIFRSFNLKHRGIWLTGMVCLLTTGFASAADRRPHGQPLYITAPETGSVNANLSQFDAHTTSQPNLEEALQSPAFNPKSSLDGVMAPPIPTYQPRPQQRALSKREKELLDIRKNWAFSTPEELLGATARDRGNSPADAEDTEKKPTTVMERYFENMSKSNRMTNQTRRSELFGMKGATNSLTGNFFGGNPAPENVFNSGSNPDVFKAALARQDSFSDVFGFNKGMSPEALEKVQREQKQVHDERMNDFKKIWDLDQPAVAVTPGRPLLPASSSDSFSSQHRTFNPMVGTINAGNADTHPSSLAPVAPRPIPARVAPPKPDFSAPQRRF